MRLRIGNILDYAIHKWNCGTAKPADVEISMNELMSTIHDHLVLKMAGQRVNMPPEIESAVWNIFQKGWGMRDTLNMMSFYIRNDSRDLYFDWFRMEETCRELWAQVSRQFHFCSKFQGKGYSGPDTKPSTMATKILDQAYNGESLFSEQRMKVLYQESAPLLTMHWKTIQSFIYTKHQDVVVTVISKIWRPGDRIRGNEDVLER